MGKTSDALAAAKKQGLSLKLVEEPQWKLWMRDPTPSKWLVIGSHGASPHEDEVDFDFQATIHFTTRKGECAPGDPNSVYLRRVLNGTTRGESFSSKNKQKPFDYTLTKYAEDPHIKTVLDMQNGDVPFDVITIKKGQQAKLSDILAWLVKGKYGYADIVAGFCNSSSYGKIFAMPAVPTGFKLKPVCK